MDAETWNWNYIFVTDLMRHVLIMFDTRVTHTQRWGSWPASWKGSIVSIYCNNVIYFRISISISPNTPSAILHGLSLLAEKIYSLKHWTWGKKVCYGNFPIYLCVFIWNLRARRRVEEEFWWKSVVVRAQ